MQVIWLKRWLKAGLAVWIGLLMVMEAKAERCAVCQEEITGEKVYLLVDKVTNEKKHLCSDCVKLTDICFVCGLPVRQEATTLPDGRIFCGRDAQSAVLDVKEAKEICLPVRNDLDRAFYRCASFPRQVALSIVDRVNLLTLFKVPGNDRQCPNVLGYFYVQTNQQQVIPKISVLSGLTASQLRAVCAHEYGHAWISANVSGARRKRLGHDAEEGFCELVAWILMDAQQDEGAKETILRNEYTRGQIQLFVEAQRLFGLNVILQWIRSGADAQLDEDNIYRIRELRAWGEDRTAAPAQKAVPEAGLSAVAPPEALSLRGISWLPGRALAMVNDRSLAAGESVTIRLGETNLLIKCLAIRQNAVRIQIVGSGEEQELLLR